MLALVLYPLVVEPLFGLEEQTLIWTVGYGVLVALVITCGIVVWQGHRKPELALAEVPPLLPASQATPPPSEPSSTAIAPGKTGNRFRITRKKVGELPPTQAPNLQTSASHGPRPVTALRRLRWIGLAAAPTSLMLGLTTYLTTDIAAIPFFWVVPLALYLLTFILVFARWPIEWVKPGSDPLTCFSPHTMVLFAQPCFLMALVLVVEGGVDLPTWALFLMHTVAFFTTTLMCHGELARDRPDPQHLTEFYLYMSLGGVLGGLFNGLIAPTFFWFGVVEYTAAMAFSCLLRPNLVTEVTLFPTDANKDGPTPLGHALDVVVPLAIGAVAWFALVLGVPRGHRAFYLALPIILTLALMARPLRMALSFGLLCLAAGVFDRKNYPYLHEDRGFFGFVRVREYPDESRGRIYRTLVHGGINHGTQIIEPAEMRRRPITYFHPTGGIGQIFAKFSWRDERLPASLVGLGTDPWSTLACTHSEPAYAVVGLGIGNLATHARPYQHVDIYEIDPLVRRLSIAPEGQEPYFFYVKDAIDRGANLSILMGDGRLSLKKPATQQDKGAPKGFYHILVLDAFSSDAIPVHLLTKDAVQEYLTNLAEGGVLIFNTTNKFVDIAPVLGDIARDLDLEVLYFGDYSGDVEDKFGADWVVMQRRGFDKDAKTGQSRDYTGGPPLTIRLDDRWKPPASLGGRIWTDNYSNLLKVMQW